MKNLTLFNVLIYQSSCDNRFRTGLDESTRTAGTLIHSFKTTNFDEVIQYLSRASNGATIKYTPDGRFACSRMFKIVNGQPEVPDANDIMLWTKDQVRLIDMKYEAIVNTLKPATLDEIELSMGKKYDNLRPKEECKNAAERKDSGAAKDSD